MEIKYIKCPKCGVTLQVKNSKNEDIKTIKCPSCQSTLKVIFRRNPNGNPNESLSDGSETRYGAATSQVSSFYLTTDGRRYALPPGYNTVGRRASDSTAKIMIDTDDRTMSRSHAVINITRLSSGSYKAVIMNAKNKNNTYVNGVLLEGDDAIILSDGDEIVMGRTTLKVKTI